MNSSVLQCLSELLLVNANYMGMKTEANSYSFSEVAQTVKVSNC